MKILVVSENISMKMGGESSLPYYYAKLFSESGEDVVVACHERCREEVEGSLAGKVAGTVFVRDRLLQIFLDRLSRYLPYRIKDIVIGQLIHYLTQFQIRKEILRLVRSGDVDIVLEPSPISPKGLSFMYGLGVPVVIGPLCGGMTFPPAFRKMDSILTQTIIRFGRFISESLNKMVPGKIEANILLVANETTRRALPRAARGKVLQIYESGVDLDIWRLDQEKSPIPDKNKIRFVYSGRFVDWKGIQYLLPAFEKAITANPNCVLQLIGGGGEYQKHVENLAENPNMKNQVDLVGWTDRENVAEIMRKADVFVMPSLRECGGTAILEAMALGLPVITTNWGGPADYVDSSCGILVDPNSEEGFIDGLANAIVELTVNSELRQRLSIGARQRIKHDYLDWRAKGEKVLSILREEMTIHKKRIN